MVQRRKVVIAFASLGFLISLYLGLFQLGVTQSVWDPVFGMDSRHVLFSRLSTSLPIPDAILGAVAYLAEVVLVSMQKEERSIIARLIRYLYIIMAIGMGVVGLFLTGYQTFSLHAWCLLCLCSAAISIGLVIPAFIEWRLNKNGNSPIKPFYGNP